MLSWYSIMGTLWKYALVENGGFPSWAVIKWSCSSRRTPTLCLKALWLLFNSIWIYFHPTAYYFKYFPLPVLRTIFKCASWVICLVAALAASQWTHWFLNSCCVPISDMFDIVPANQLDLDTHSPGCGHCASIICCCGFGEEDDNEKKWDVLRTI